MTPTRIIHLLLLLPSSTAFLSGLATGATIAATKKSPPSSSSSSSKSSSSFSVARDAIPPSTFSSLSSSSLEDDDGDTNADFSGFGDTGIVILAGGTGSRMKSNVPKQFLLLDARPVLHYSLHLFLEKLVSHCATNDISPPRHVVLVMDPTYQPQYQDIVDAYDGRLSFASPGKERQGSVENGLNALLDATRDDGGGDCAYVAIHDSARPLVTIREVCDVVRDAHVVGAAVLGVPCKATIKESDDGITVTRTVPRSRLWEVHTPQVVRCEALLRGFEKVEREGLEVTDDVSIIEALGEPVRLTRGEYTNLKITTPEDMDVASAILADRDEGEIYLSGCDGGGGGRAAIADAVASKNPFAAIPRAGHLREREYNTLREVKLFDRDLTGRRYPAKPTPSRWQE